jgi:hypothetical protein
VYESSVLIRNMTAVTRTLTVLPLSSQFFCVAAVAYPSKDQGTLAPGMAVKVTVRFEPDSLADYEDHLTIKSEGSCDWLVCRCHALSLQAETSP